MSKQAIAYTPNEMADLAKELFHEERRKARLDGWFLARKTASEHAAELADRPAELQAAYTLRAIINEIPLYVSEYAIFCGTQSDAFARSYALINPSFTVESFSGYCDPTAVFNDIEPNEKITAQTIADVKKFTQNTEYVRALNKTYDKYSDYTAEVAFFIEQVTGHVIPDFRFALKNGLNDMLNQLSEKEAHEQDSVKKINYQSMHITLESVLLLANRYADIVHAQQATAKPKRKEQLVCMEHTLRTVPANGAKNLYEAIQLYMLLWQVMCMEQAPNPFAFSVGNADRIFEPYRAMENTDRATAAALFRHLLVFYNVGDRSWAISQNILIGGKSNDGQDLTNPTTYALLDAYYDMNLPQPILSVKLHQNTPAELYRQLGRFFFTPGCLTPSIFNDDALFPVLAQTSGVAQEDLQDYSVAGCQEPLIMGKDNGNTTNSWLNLAKILELTLNNGASTLTGKQIGSKTTESFESVLKHLRTAFYDHAKVYIDKMTAAANEATAAVSFLPVPFLSVFMGGMETGYDMRDVSHQGTKYNGSGCLIHGLSILADSFIAVDHLLKERPQDIARLQKGLQNDFADDEELRSYLLACPKYGNNIPEVDTEAAEIVRMISDMVAAHKNDLGNAFRPDWSSPSTHLLYGYWVGATPDGRKAREMLGYGVDPLYGEAGNGLGFRLLSNMQLPFEKMNGGYASHFGVDPKFFTAESYEEKGMDFANRIIRPLFFNPQNKKISPFYLYVNVTTPEILRKVLENPKKYAPSGVYIMRIHGTFVNFLDLSPAIQQDIIRRLDLHSTALC